MIDGVALRLTVGHTASQPARRARGGPVGNQCVGVWCATQPRRCCTSGSSLRRGCPRGCSPERLGCRCASSTLRAAVLISGRRPPLLSTVAPLAFGTPVLDNVSVVAHAQVQKRPDSRASCAVCQCLPELYCNCPPLGPHSTALLRVKTSAIVATSASASHSAPSRAAFVPDWMLFLLGAQIEGERWE